MEFAARESFSISESDCAEEKVSVVLTEDFKLKTYKHPSSCYYTSDILYVLYSFDCETYILEYSDINNFLSEEKIKEFHNFHVENAKNLLD